MEAIVFWVLAIGMVGAALAIVFNRNPVASALSLVVTFLFLAGIFVTLEAFFLAMVQIIVYAGAVMVLFLFIIMLLDIKAEEKRPIPWVKAGIVGLVAAAFGGVYFSVLGSIAHGKAALVWGENTVELTAAKLGQELFTKYILPFEVTGLLLLVATIGVVLLSRRLNADDPKSDGEQS
jgi:NADH-quinone oxidoreductase subunit J